VRPGDSHSVKYIEDIPFYPGGGGGYYVALFPNVAGSLPDGVIGNFHCHDSSGRTMALGSTQPLTEMSTRISGVLISP
jgi:hypothetical protein